MNSIKDNECMICIEPLKKNKSKELNCKHIFHIECIQKWYNVQQTCPICRTEIDPNEIDKKNKKNNNNNLPYYIEIITDYTTLPSAYQTTNRNNNTNTNTNTNSSCIIKKHLMIILNIFIFLGIVCSFTANIFCQNNFINEIKNYIEYMNDSNNTDTLIIDYNHTYIDYNQTDIDNNHTDIVNDYKNPGSDTFYIFCAIAYMVIMLIITINYISKKNLESNPRLTNHYIGFYIITVIMFCTHLYYILDVINYMNEYKYPNIKKYDNIEDLYHTYLITSMTSLSILIFSFLVKMYENTGLSLPCCFIST
jgi:hypothetical protein